MLKGVAWLLGFQGAGELVSTMLRLPISGAVCGMTLLLVWLFFSGAVPEELQRVTDGLLANMPLLFVPVGAGLIVYLDLLQRHWLFVVICVVGGTFVTLGTTALAAQYMAKHAPENEMDGRAVRELPINNSR